MALRLNVTLSLGAGLLALTACGGNSSPTGSTTVVSPLPSFTVSGVVRENLAAGPGPAVGNARVDVVGKPGVVTTTQSDADGHFSVSGVYGEFQLSASKPGYRTATVTVGPIAADTSKDIAIEPIPHVLTGHVFETPPTQSKPIAGARVDIVSGANAGASTTTDASGGYRFANVWGDVQLQASAPGYTPTHVAVTVADGDASADAQLDPEPRVITESLTTRYIDVGSADYPYTLRRTFDVHNDGEIAVTDLSCYGFEQGDGCILELWDSGQLAVSQFFERSYPRNTIALRVQARAGRHYELRVKNTPIIVAITYRFPS